jgi:hypothetical protein
MGKLFCSECGFKNEYALTRPKFCSNCGNNLSKEGNNNKPTKKNISNLNDSDEDEVDVKEVPRIKKLEYDLDLSEANNFYEFKRLPRQKPEIQPLRKKSDT